MSVAIALMSVPSFASLPAVIQYHLAGLQEVFDEEFVPSKNRRNKVLGVLEECIVEDVRTDVGFLLMFRYIVLEDEDYSEKMDMIRAARDEGSDTQSTCSSSIPSTVSTGSKKGRPCKNRPNDLKHRCYACETNFSSRGSLFNHYKSTSHRASMLSKLDVMIDADHTERTICVTFRDRRSSQQPKYQVKGDVRATLRNLRSYVETNNSNPLMNVSFIFSS